MMIDNFTECIENIYSKVDKKTLLHQLYKPSSRQTICRENLSPVSESIQVSYLRMKKDQTFKAHKHIIFNRNMPIAQESWVVISGKVKVFYYDLDDTLITTREVESGSCTITYKGGHHYQSLEENTVVYEFKTGPYFGIDKDKVLINIDKN